ncbi:MULTISPECIES: GNAT family N-acetyltransferase [unclassified Salinivibrio]|uniref:GNAT family N-acetyltransferase n=1 Tax=unclassified Salinivibrio TaxID=2636825 RepID=UPI00128BAABB|nr:MULTISPECIES: GNAT family protein [unclassified Salinivibrio]MPS31739.1 N-acetyltransferase [Salinivibrio sp. VYel7]MPX90309.1 N-acetyltransferase [Salinivibrio sp. VYel1]MPX93133.1 N-acetyltransferase [Salinivibrio sp. VYel9]MPX95183.1 N-acetyltransferase [Salinivibrio sp. VYel6]MPX99351.1 N-acetyltransferase [Salinivibrio sp. VYel4]
MFMIETRRLVLRDMQPSDEEAFVHLTQHQKYQRFYSETDCQPETYRYLHARFIEQANANPRVAYQLAVICKQSEKCIGTVGLRLEDNHQASIGCGLAVEAQGAGLMREAAVALANFGFECLGVHRLYAETIYDNLAATKLCRSLGMRQEAHFHQHRFFKERWWDTVVYAILRHEWEQG